jgi:hypothetical protein
MWLRYWYRVLRGRCVVCNGDAQAHREGPWVRPLTHACGWCNKRVQHGLHYGMGPRQAQKTMREEKCQ